MSVGKPFLAPIRSRIRKYAQEVAQGDGAELEMLERAIRSPGEEGLPAGLFCSHPLLRVFARLARWMDPDGLLTALQRGHYRAVSRAPQPVLRRYTYRGFAVVHDIRNKSQWNAYIKAIHQPGITHWIRYYLPPGGMAMDIGANAGVLSLEMVAQNGPDGQVYAFEPNPEAYRLLEQAIAKNGLEERLRLNPQALGTRTEDVTLSIPDVNNGAASVREPQPGEDSITIPVVGFNAWWAEQGRPAIDFVKIDVEGFEREVVAAMQPLLARDRPSLVLEVDPAAYDAGALLDCLKGHDYRLFEIIHQPPYCVALEGTPGKQTDLLAISPGVEGP